MIKRPITRPYIVFWLLVLTDLLSLSFGFTGMHFIVKPLLMPALGLSLVFADIARPGKNLIITGLLFSWLGDIFLLFESYNPLFFIFGLISFLITHTCYIFYFFSFRPLAPSFIVKRPIFIFLIAGYGSALVWLLFPYLNELKIPVIIYSAVICCMLGGSIHIYLKVQAPANRYFISGAALFVLSDSILAINKFYQPLPIAGTFIMLSYCAAQYFIIKGFMAGKKEGSLA